MGRTGQFRLYDYGSAKANVAAYGTPAPPDIKSGYGLLGASCAVSIFFMSKSMLAKLVNVNKAETGHACWPSE
jgi:hypothetical protein